MSTSIIYRGVGGEKLCKMKNWKNWKIGKILNKIQNGVRIIVHHFE